jgi:hypothetical protein
MGKIMVLTEALGDRGSQEKQNKETVILTPIGSLGAPVTVLSFSISVCFFMLRFLLP